MVTAPVLALTCLVCGWIPDPDVPMEEVAKHYADRHPGTEVTLDLTAFCPRDGRRLAVRMNGVRPSDGRQVTTYDCPHCRRTFRVVWAPGEQPPAVTR